MYSNRWFEIKHWSDITVADLPYIESPFFASSFIERSLKNDLKVSDVVSHLSGYYFRSSMRMFPGRGSKAFPKWRNDLVRGMENGEFLLVFKDKKKPFCPLIESNEDSLTATSASPSLADRLIARANPTPPPPPAITGEVMDVTALNGNPGWESKPRESTSHQAPPKTYSAPPAQTAPAASESAVDEQAQAQALKNTAKDELPFCEECEKSGGAGSASPSSDSSVSEKSGSNDNGATTPDNKKVCTSGEPISMVTGEELLDLTDFTVAGPLPIIWKRTYKSSNPHQRGLGVGWTHMLCQQLEEQEGRLVFTTDEGRYIDFPLADPGQTVLNSAEHLELRRIDDTHYVLKQRGEPTRLFVGTGGVYRLEGLLDGVGNGVRIQYWRNLDGYERPVTLIQTSWGKRLYVLHNA
ncbi:DUF6531 domain-containing protein, partial [Hahella sp. CR1]|uniref:DUF6531 domain-containing protein n=1 Tax=Hahella sp. CR1 TaxID=2992807 RepID=UPI00244141F5